MNLNGLMIYNGSLYSEKFIDYANMLQSAAIKKGHHVELVKNNELFSLMHTNKTDILSNLNLNRIDYIIFTDKDIYLAHQLVALGIRLFIIALSTDISDDKIKTYQKLMKSNLPIPETLIGPINFIKPIESNRKFITQSIEHFGFPFIIKEAYGSFGEQVYLIKNNTDIEKALSKINDRPFMCQSFIDSSFGTDIRVQVVGNEVVTAMKRTSINDFRANVTTGGKMQNYLPSNYEKHLAIEATKSLGLDFAGVDLLFGKNSERIICEVNSNAHIRNLLNCTGINVADYMLDYIDREMIK